MPTYFDSSDLINLGSAPNANDGDTLRVAGSKINTALQDIDSALDALDSDFRVDFDSSQIGANAISTVKIQDGAVTSDKLASGAFGNNVYGGSLNFNASANDDIITIDAGDQVGINETNPDYQLHVTSPTGSTTANFEAPSDTTVGITAGNNTAGGTFKINATADNFRLKSQSATIGSDNAFLKYDESTNVLRLMGDVNITNTNQVGIGTTPLYKLHVDGDIFSEGTGSIRLENSGSIEIANASSNGHIDFKTTSGEDHDVRIQQASNGLSVHTGGNGSAAERLRINSSGNVGIGTTSPSDKLHVEDGTVKSQWTSPGAAVEAFHGKSTDTSATMLKLENSTGNVTLRRENEFASLRVSDATDLRIYHNGVFKYQFQSDGDFVATGDVTAFGSLSDRNLKENIENIPNALEKVSKINGVTFNYIGSKESMTGVVAQEVQEVLPEVIYETVDNTREDGRALAVRYGNMVGLLIEAIKELKAEVEVLKNKE